MKCCLRLALPNYFYEGIELRIKIPHVEFKYSYSCSWLSTSRHALVFTS